MRISRRSDISSYDFRKQIRRSTSHNMLKWYKTYSINSTSEYTAAYDRVEACNTCYNVIPTEAYNRVEACNTCCNVISTVAYNRVEACNTCYNVIPTEA